MLNVLVTGAGSPTGVGVMRSLRKRDDVRIIGVDPNLWTGAEMFADAWERCPWGSDPNFETFLGSVADKYSIDVAFVTITSEIQAAHNLRLPFWGCSPEAVELTEDKWLFARQMRCGNIPHPRTFNKIPETGGGPWVIKPVRGEGSKDTFVAKTRTLMAALKQEYPDSIIQDKLSGSEWEVDVFAHDGGLLGGVAFVKHRMKGGITMKVETIPLETVAEEVERTIAVCELEGPLNIGGFLTATGNQILEVNARFSHGFLIGEAAGAQPMDFYINFVLNGTVDRTCLQTVAGVRFERFYTEQVI